MENPTKGKRWIKRISWAIALLLLGLTILLRPALRSWITDRETRARPAGNTTNDASRLNESPIAERIDVEENLEQATQQLQRLLARARAGNLPISIAGARHSMGGHTIMPNGILLDMSGFKTLELIDRATLRTGAGARWSEIIQFLNAEDLSVGIMQSNNSFSVGGSISVNCHGWQFGRPPICDTVKAFRLMTADGTIHTCSRSENPELFSLVLGGYGLLGIILEVDLTVVPNERYRQAQYFVPAAEGVSFFDDRVAGNSSVAMAYGRMRVDSKHFLEEITVTVMNREVDAPHHQDEIQPAGLRGLRRHLFRGSIGDNYGKTLRWWAETKLQPFIQSETIWRNNLISEPVTVFENRSSKSTDILHEYFVPREGVGLFAEALREIIPSSEVDLLNVTIRHIETDNDTFLRYADQRLFAFVMLFNQPRTPSGEEAMGKLTRRLIDAADDVGGRYYLPYRLHATPEQFHRAYPQAKEFFELKRKYDPSEIFQNQFYQKYGK